MERWWCNFWSKTKNSYFTKLNKKERRLALQTLLYNKKNNILIIENLENEIN
jgi:ribosomal protein L4